MMRRRRPLLRGALVGGAGFMAGRNVARHQQAEAQQDAQLDQLQSQQQDPAAQQAPPPPPAPAVPAGGSSMVDELTKLGSLKTQGLISDEEFTAAKAKLLGT
jgi:hypothetical protein